MMSVRGRRRRFAFLLFAVALIGLGAAVGRNLIATHQASLTAGRRQILSRGELLSEYLNSLLKSADTFLLWASLIVTQEGFSDATDPGSDLRTTISRKLMFESAVSSVSLRVGSGEAAWSVGSDGVMLPPAEYRAMLSVLAGDPDRSFFGVVQGSHGIPVMVLARQLGSTSNGDLIVLIASINRDFLDRNVPELLTSEASSAALVDNQGGVYGAWGSSSDQELPTELSDLPPGGHRLLNQSNAVVSVGQLRDFPLRVMTATSRRSIFSAWYRSLWTNLVFTLVVVLLFTGGLVTYLRDKQTERYMQLALAQSDERHRIATLFRQLHEVAQRADEVDPLLEGSGRAVAAFLGSRWWAGAFRHWRSDQASSEGVADTVVIGERGTGDKDLPGVVEDRLKQELDGGLGTVRQVKIPCDQEAESGLHPAVILPLDDTLTLRGAVLIRLDATVPDDTVQVLQEAVSVVNRGLWRIASDRQLRSTLADRELLLREVHHRVKNNLAIIDSLLRFEELRGPDQATLDILTAVRNRIHAISLIHRHLYQSETLSLVSMKAYIEDLARHMFNALASDEANYSLTTDVADIRLDIDKVKALGLILHELISNAFKYGKDTQGRLELLIGLERLRGGVLLRVSDNGPGFREVPTGDSLETLGFLITSSLVEELGGTMNLENDGGTTIEVWAPVNIQETPHA